MDLLSAITAHQASHWSILARLIESIRQFAVYGNWQNYFNLSLRIIMANEEDTGMSEQELVERAWTMAKGMHVAWLITASPNGQAARPMSPHVDAHEDAIYFLTSVTSDTVQQLDLQPAASIVFSNVSKNQYVSFSGVADVSNDRAKIHELWTPFAKAWWESAQDSAIRLVTFQPKNAELWDGPNQIVASAKMLFAALTGNKPAVGKHANVAL